MKQFFILFSTLFFLSCQPEGRVFIEHQELSPEVEWLKKDIKTFKVPVVDVNQNYNMSLSFRYINGYPYQVARVTVTEITPSGKESKRDYELKVRNNDGSYIGEPGYDIWDSEHLIETNVKFTEKGTYTYVLEHNMPDDPLNYAMEIGVILDVVK